MSDSRPFQTVRFRGPAATVDAVSLIDTGAAVTVVTGAVVRQSGILLHTTARVPLEGVGGGSLVARLGLIEIEFAELTEPRLFKVAVTDGVSTPIIGFDVQAALGVHVDPETRRVVRSEAGWARLGKVAVGAAAVGVAGWILSKME